MTNTLTEITAERFDEMLNILPPLFWRLTDAFDQKINRIPETFCMSEMLTGSLTSQFAALDGRYFERTVDALDRSTWITGEEIDRFTGHPYRTPEENMAAVINRVREPV